MDSAIDLTNPPWALLLQEEDSFFWEGKGLRKCLGSVPGWLKASSSLCPGPAPSATQCKNGNPLKCKNLALLLADKLLIRRNAKIAIQVQNVKIWSISSFLAFAQPLINGSCGAMHKLLPKLKMSRSQKWQFKLEMLRSGELPPFRASNCSYGAM